jgi:hypothetical protein
MPPIREVPVSNVLSDSGHFHLDFKGFRHFIQENAWTMPQITVRLIPSTPFQVRY